MNVKTLEAQEKKIMAEAKRAGVADSYLFQTTFDRYKTQVRMCIQLSDAMEKEPLLVTKEYVKGRQNVVANPLIQAINQSFTGANKSAETLVRLIKAADKAEAKQPKKDPLLEALRG